MPSLTSGPPDGKASKAMPRALTSARITAQLRDDLGIDAGMALIAHANMTALGPVDGGPEAVRDAILSAAGTVLMPAFTYQTQIVPQTGPPDNALVYGSGDAANAKAEIFRPDLPVHPDCGSVAEALRHTPGALRSIHPILSFVAYGLHAREALASQTRHNPLAPLAWLEAHSGDVLLMGVDQRENYALHLAEQRAGRKTFTRWALTMDDIEELPNIPGCMEGFNAIWRELISLTRAAKIGLARCELIPLRDMLNYAERRIRNDPNFLLCDRPSCLSCRARESQD
jgi:aminoglycoside 3-N-acetyltransferase